MSTQNVLQTPEIVSIIGSTIRIRHPRLDSYTRTTLGSSIAAAGTTMTVVDNNVFSDNDFFIVGEIGDSKTESGDVNGAVSRGGSITVTNSLSFSHEIDAPVTRIMERGIKIYGAATSGGAGTLIASVDAIASPIADAVMIQWNKPATEYTMISTDTEYAYYFCKFTDSTTDSSASDYILATGLTATTAQSIADNAMMMTNTRIGSLITSDFLVKAIQESQQMVTHYSDERGIPVNWDFELVEDVTSIALTENENKYSLGDLTYEIKYPDSPQGILNLRYASDVIKFISPSELDKKMEGSARTEIATQAEISDTTLVVDDSYELAEQGTVYVGGDTVTYTGNTESTGTLTGVPASGSGSITEVHVVDSAVWQGITPGVATYYSIYDNNILLDAPIKADDVGKKLKLRYLKKLTDITELSDVITIPFFHILQFYIAYKISLRKNETERALYFKGQFDIELLRNANARAIYTLEQSEYYTFNENEPLDVDNEEASESI